MARLDDILAGATRLDKADENQPHQLMQMVYAEPGAGKTILLAKLAQEIRGDGFVFFADSHEGFVTLQEKQWEPLRTNVIRKRIDDPQLLSQLGDAFLEGDKRLKNITVVQLDELSSWVKRIAVAYIRRTKGGGTPNGLMPAIEGSDWNPIGWQVAEILDKFMQAGVHVLIAAHSREKGDRDGGTKLYSPNFTPLMNIDIQGMLHQTTLLTNRLAGRGQYERTLHTRPTASIQAKSRVEGMPMNPTEKQFLQLTGEWVRGERATETGKSVRASIKEKPTPAAPTVDSILPSGDEGLDLEDQPVIVDEQK